MARNEQDHEPGEAVASTGNPATEDEARLLALYRRVSPAQRRALLDHAERLAATCAAPVVSGAAAPGAIDRPSRETVVQAIRRLTRAYPGLERGRLMGATARGLAEHMIDGREAGAVIDELEALFAREHARSAGGGAAETVRPGQVRPQRDDA